jgi:hypothetical protein
MSWPDDSFHRIGEGGIPEKWCPGCSRWRVAGAYWTNAGRMDGLASYCKPCARARRRGLRLDGALDRGEARRLRLRETIRDPAALDRWDEAEARHEDEDERRPLSREEIGRRLERVAAAKASALGRRLSGAELDAILDDHPGR